MLCCSVSVIIYQASWILRKYLTGLVKCVDLRSTYTIAAFSPSRLWGSLGEISPEKKVIFSDYVTVALVRVYEVINFSLILFIEQTCVQRTTSVLIKQTSLKPSGFLLSHNVC